MRRVLARVQGGQRNLLRSTGNPYRFVGILTNPNNLSKAPSGEWRDGLPEPFWGDDPACERFQYSVGMPNSQRARTGGVWRIQPKPTLRETV